MSHSVPQRILCLSGGGVKGYASLLILEDLWKFLENGFVEHGLSHKFSKDARPCEFFTLIGGTSTGAIIAVMLGKLMMTIGECMDAYKKFSKYIFKTSAVGLVSRFATTKSCYSSLRLRKVIEKFLDDKLGTGGRDALLWDKTSANSICKTAIATIPTNTFKPTLLRSWSESDVGPKNGWKLVDAILAATAAPALFPPHNVEGCEYLDAAYNGFNNPAELLLDESIRLSGQHLMPALFLDIGTGRHDVTYHGQGIWAWIKTLKEFVTTSEHPSKVIKPQLNQRTKRVYFRLCVDEGMEDIHVPDYEKLPKIEEATNKYCQSNIDARRKYFQIEKVVKDVITGTSVPVFDVCNIGTSIDDGCLIDAKSWKYLIDFPNEFMPYILQKHKDRVNPLKSAVALLSGPTNHATLSYIQRQLSEVLEILYKDLDNLDVEASDRPYGSLQLCPAEASNDKDIDKNLLSKILNEMVLVSAYHFWVWEKINLQVAKDLEPEFQGLLRSAERQRTRDGSVEPPTCKRLWHKETEILRQKTLLNN